MRVKNRMKCLLPTLALSLLVAPVLADGAEIAVAYKGSDLWTTIGAASTFTSFADDPIPADFFCPGSPAFDGRIRMEGKPLLTDPPGFLGYADTVVERLDDATFDATGLAITRIRMRALSLVGEEPVDMGCDQPFEVAVSLAGEQPITEMRIQKTEADGGTYQAPLALRTRLTFTPVGDGETLSIESDVYLGPGSNTYWTTAESVGHDIDGNPIQVDLDGDGVPAETILGRSNFRTGISLATQSGGGCPTCKPGDCVKQVCHCAPCSTDPNEPNGACDPKHMHCTYVCAPATSGFCMMCF